jgi:hypothetical protein
MWLFWLTLAASTVAVIASLVFTTRRGLQVFRDAKKLSASSGEALDRVSRSSEQIERHLALAAESGTRLDRSLERLRTSRAQLNVQLAAIDDVRAFVGQITGLAPRK